LASTLFGDGEHDEEKNGERAAGDSGDGLGKEVDDGDDQQGEGDESEAEWDLNAVDGEVERNLEVALAGFGVTEDEDGEAVHGEGPDDAEGVEVREEIDVAAADNDGSELKQNDDVDDAIAGAEFWMRLAEPGGEHAVFRDAVENTV